MIFVTGDTHGDFTRLNSANFPEQKGMGKEDYVIICGDFGGVWDNSKQERYWLDWLEHKPFTTLFVSGNHENYDLLEKLPVTLWHGGKVQAVRPSVLHLMRGQVFELAGKRIFTMGGASCHDIQDGILEPDDPSFSRKKKQLDARRALYRINHRTWWRQELPSDAEYQEAEQNLAACGGKVDWILSHCAPSSLVDLLGDGLYQHDRLTDYLETLRERVPFQYWFFGHYHDNRAFQQRFILLYEQILQVEPPD